MFGLDFSFISVVDPSRRELFSPVPLSVMAGVDDEYNMDRYECN